MIASIPSAWGHNNGFESTSSMQSSILVHLYRDQPREVLEDSELIERGKARLRSIFL